MASPEPARKSSPCRLIVVGGHTRSIGKTQLVCDLIAALPKAKWLAGKITQYGHGVCATNGHECDCAPTEHIVALDWESSGGGSTDSARFLQAGAVRSFWLRTKQGYLAEGMPPLREALTSAEKSAGTDGLNVIVESNSLLQFLKPSLYVTVLDAAKIADLATYEKPHQYAAGVEYVVVNGTVVLERGRQTGARPGAILYGPGHIR